MTDKAKKKEQGSAFVKGNFSCHLANLPAKKDDFVKMFTGKVDSDIGKLWDEAKKAQTAYFRTVDGKKEKEDKTAD